MVVEEEAPQQEPPFPERQLVRARTPATAATRMVIERNIFMRVTYQLSRLCETAIFHVWGNRALFLPIE